MKRVLALCSLALVLGSCGGGGSTPAASVSDQTIALATAASTPATQNFDGSWTIRNVPSWLSVTPLSGTGNVSVTVTAKRGAAATLKADQPSLSGAFDVVWTAKSSATTNTAHWTVTASNYTLTGRVLDSAQLAALSVSGADISATSTGVGEDTNSVPGSILVTYRTPQTRNAALSAVRQQRQMSAQGVSGQGLSAQSLKTLHSLSDTTVLTAEPLTDQTLLLRHPATAEALSALRADPDVLSAVPDQPLHAMSLSSTSLASTSLNSASLTSTSLNSPVVPTDQYAPLQWAYSLLGYGAVWRDMQAGGYTHPVTVAVIDTGVRYDHPDLAGKLWKGSEGALDLITDPSNGDSDGVDTDPTDPGSSTRTTASHGTHVAGIIAANWGSFAAPCSACSTSGVVGASSTAPIMVLPIRVLNESWISQNSAVINAIRYAAGLSVTVGTKTYTNPHPAQVINLSLGGTISTTDAQPLCDAVSEAASAGSLIFVAAGNDSTTAPSYPAACPGAVSVASVTLSGGSAPVHASYSQSYAQVQLSAPGGVNPNSMTYFNGGTFNGQAFGDLILSTSWNYAKAQPSYEGLAGTSQAAPQASVLAALLLSKGVTTNAADTLARMVSTATDLGAAGRDAQFGYGMINAAAALGAAPISDSLGLRLQSADGVTFQPALDSLGRFTAYLPDGTYQVVAGRDRNGNGVYGESGEPQDTRSVTLNATNPVQDLKEMTPR